MNGNNLCHVELEQQGGKTRVNPPPPLKNVLMLGIKSQQATIYAHYVILSLKNRG